MKDDFFREGSVLSRPGLTSCRSYLKLRPLLVKEQHRFKSATVCMLALLVISQGSQELAIIFLESCVSQFEV